MDHFPEPSSPLTEEEFLDSLDQNNPAIAEVRDVFRRYTNSIMQIYRKDARLYDLVMARRSLYCLPIIDKPLQVVIEARDDHQWISGGLFCYHAAAAGLNFEDYHKRVRGEMYVRRGFGYYFTGAYGDTNNVVIIPEAYRPDRFDKDIFAYLGLT